MEPRSHMFVRHATEGGVADCEGRTAFASITIISNVVVVVAVVVIVVVVEEMVRRRQP